MCIRWQICSYSTTQKAKPRRVREQPGDAVYGMRPPPQPLQRQSTSRVGLLAPLPLLSPCPLLYPLLPPPSSPHLLPPLPVPLLPLSACLPLFSRPTVLPLPSSASAPSPHLLHTFFPLPQGHSSLPQPLYRILPPTPFHSALLSPPPPPFPSPRPPHHPRPCLLPTPSPSPLPRPPPRPLRTFCALPASICFTSPSYPPHLIAPICFTSPSPPHLLCFACLACLYLFRQRLNLSQQHLVSHLVQGQAGTNSTCVARAGAKNNALVPGQAQRMRDECGNTVTTMTKLHMC